RRCLKDLNFWYVGDGREREHGQLSRLVPTLTVQTVARREEPSWPTSRSGPVSGSPTSDHSPSAPATATTCGRRSASRAPSGAREGGAWGGTRPRPTASPPPPAR